MYKCNTNIDNKTAKKKLYNKLVVIVAFALNINTIFLKNKRLKILKNIIVVIALQYKTS